MKKIKTKLPVTFLLFTLKGRINRPTYWLVSVFIWSSFYTIYNLLNFVSYSSTKFIYPLLFWALFATAVKRLHDSNRYGHWLWLILIPVIGPLLLIYLLGFKKSSPLRNRFGAKPNTAPDYYKNIDAISIPHLQTGEKIVNDVTQLNPVLVSKVEIPTTIKELQNIIAINDIISVGGGRFSMGGQTASSSSTHIDMRKLNKVLEFDEENKTIKVEAGIRWCDIQQHIDPYNLSLKIMQTYANFTVGGSLSVNCHGRYIGFGALILSVKSIEIILANGDKKIASTTTNSELFFASIGCYNAIGVIATVEFELTENIAVKRVFKRMKTTDYKNFFVENIKNKGEIIFHNADLYPPKYTNARAVSWIKTNEKPTVATRLMPLAEAYPIERYFINAFSKSNFGKWRRENIIDPIVYLKKKIHWRNYEAGYDVAELEPESREHSTYVLQEYFVPINKFNEFTKPMSAIFNRHNVNVLNVSVRHANKDIGSLLAWAKEEVFAFVVWYKQHTHDIEKNKVAVWTRELIDAVIALNGSYYLPYQAHATQEQFHKAYPNAIKLFELKKQLDPTYKFRNILWNTYYKSN